jgi:hypothetical protein
MSRGTGSLATRDRPPVRAYARVAGVLYLIIIVIGLLSEALIRGRLIVGGDPDATARNILNAQFLWRLGIAGEDVLLVCAIALTLLWYVLLRPVDKRLTQLAIAFAFVSLAVESVGALHLHAVLTPLLGGTYLTAVDPALLHVMAYQSVIAHAHAFGLALIFFGVECLVIGHLIRRSGFFPRAVGMLMQLAGLCYLVNSFSMILAPSLQDMLFPFVLLPSLIGESTFCLWLLIKGVDVAAWERRADTV